MRKILSVVLACLLCMAFMIPQISATEVPDELHKYPINYTNVFFCDPDDIMSPEYEQTLLTEIEPYYMNTTIPAVYLIVNGAGEEEVEDYLARFLLKNNLSNAATYCINTHNMKAYVGGACLGLIPTATRTAAIESGASALSGTNLSQNIIMGMRSMTSHCYTYFEMQEEVQKTSFLEDGNVYVHDIAELLSDEDERKLIDLAKNKLTKNSYNVVFLTNNGDMGKTTMDWSDDYLDAMFPTEEDNIAFIIDMYNREIYVNTMGQAIKRLSDDKIERTLDKGWDNASNEDYYGCLANMASYALPYLDRSEASAGFLEFIVAMFFAAWIPAILTIIVVIILSKNHKKANAVISANRYNAGEFNVISKDEQFIRSDKRIIRDYYRQSSSSSSRSGGSSHRSSSGRSHGGGGRKF